MTTPKWFQQLEKIAPSLTSEQLSWQPVPETSEREAAVLILFSEIDGEPSVTLIERPGHMRNHAGQPAFPGGGLDEGETAIEGALREAAEEIGLRPETVEIIGELPKLWVPVSGYVVTPIVAWWREPHEIAPLDAMEVERVERISIADLVRPDNRVRIRHSSGYIGPAFLVHDLTIWGFTGGLLNGLLDVLGFSEPWDKSQIIDLGE